MNGIQNIQEISNFLAIENLKIFETRSPILSIVLGIPMILKELGMNMQCPAMTVLTPVRINKVKPFFGDICFHICCVCDSFTFQCRLLLPWSVHKRRSPLCHFTLIKFDVKRDRWSLNPKLYLIVPKLEKVSLGSEVLVLPVRQVGETVILPFFKRSHYESNVEKLLSYTVKLLKDIKKKQIS